MTHVKSFTKWRTVSAGGHESAKVSSVVKFSLYHISPDTAKTIACSMVDGRLDYCNSVLYGNFITFTPTCFALAVAAVSAKLRAILLNKTCKTVQFLCRSLNSAHDGQFYANFW